MQDHESSLVLLSLTIVLDVGQVDLIYVGCVLTVWMI